MAVPRNEDVYTTLQQLVRLRYGAEGFSYLPRQSVRSLLSGRKRSRLRGRGLDFDELRHYRPGDDIRTMDWRVTNRTGKPHVRVYTEERDRPVVVMVDQRLSMFFGSAHKMKSVSAAEVAAITAWRVIAVGDRIGAVLFNDERLVEVKPVRNERKVMGWLGDLVSMNRELRVDYRHDSHPEALATALRQVERTIGHDYLVILVSDFHGWNEGTLKTLRRMARHNDVVAVAVYDPLERDISNADRLVVSDGRLQLEVDPARHDLGQKFEASFDDTFQQVQAQLKRHAIPVLSISAAQPVTEQLRQQLGGGRVRR